MKFTLNIKPYTIERSTVSGVRREVFGANPTTFSTYVSGGSLVEIRGEQYALVFNIEKRRLKRKRKAGNTRGWVVTQKPSATARVYRIPVSILKAMRKKVVQHKRHFTLESI